jgi:hypothetical protein
LKMKKNVSEDNQVFDLSQSNINYKIELNLLINEFRTYLPIT